MKVIELIEKLKEFPNDSEVAVYFWDGERKQTLCTDFIIEKLRYENKPVCFVSIEPEREWPVCLVGGHDTGCMCNLGFTPRWR